LQEISRNVDTIALALPHAVPDMHGLDKVRAMCAASGYLVLWSHMPHYMYRAACRRSNGPAIAPRPCTM
jgi:hypothetical protein